MAKSRIPTQLRSESLEDSEAVQLEPLRYRSNGGGKLHNVLPQFDGAARSESTTTRPDDDEEESDDPVTDAANAVAAALDADVILFNSGFERGIDDELIAQIRERHRRKAVMLIIVSSGGNPDAAYRISRCLQDSYEHFIAFVPGYCKSAGTLCVLGAHEVVIGDNGELGPLDVQLSKRDELAETTSGLIAAEALDALQDHAFSMYEQYFLSIVARSGNRIAFKTASKVASSLTANLLHPLYQQIDPMQVGEMARSMRIGQDYGKRLGVQGKNLKPETLELLCETYPSHGFVIDRTEAKRLLRSVRAPSAEEDRLTIALGPLAIAPVKKSCSFYLSDEEKPRSDSNDPPSDPEEQSLRDSAKPGRTHGSRVTPDSGRTAASQTTGDNSAA